MIDNHFIKNAVYLNNSFVIKLNRFDKSKNLLQRLITFLIVLFREILLFPYYE